MAFVQQDQLATAMETSRRDGMITMDWALKDAVDRGRVSLDEAIRRVKKDGWRGNPFKEKEVKKAILQITNDQAQAELVFDLAVAQRDY